MVNGEQEGRTEKEGQQQARRRPRDRRFPRSLYIPVPIRPLALRFPASACEADWLTSGSLSALRTHCPRVVVVPRPFRTALVR